MHDDYDDLASVYDRLNPKSEIYKQKSLYERIKKDYEVKSVLDCACGNGWHLEMLADMGLKTCGSDLSPAMIKQANDNLRDKGIDLRIGDYRNLPELWGQRAFDMVACLTTSLPYMLTERDVVDALNSMYSVLNEGGIVVIDNGISDSLLTEKPKLIPARILDEDAFYFFMEYHENRVVFNILYVKKTSDSFEHLFKTTTYNAMSRAVLEAAFAKTSFRHVKFYGDHDLNPYSVASKRMFVIAQK